LHHTLPPSPSLFVPCKNALSLFHLSLLCSAFLGSVKLGRVLQHHLMVGTTCRDHRITVLVWISFDIHQNRTFMLQTLLEHRFHLGLFRDSPCQHATGPCQ